MRIAVCDDCQEDVRSIKIFLQGNDVRTYFQAEELLSDVEERQLSFDLYLLDIYMEHSMGGIELAKRLRSRDSNATICFVSTSNDFYREAYDLYAVQYLLKPINGAAVRRLLERVSTSRMAGKKKKLSFKWKGETGTIPYDKILYVASRGHNLFIHCEGGTVQECGGKLDELMLKLNDDVFCRVHQSFLVNLSHVDNLTGKELIISDHTIPISRRYYEQVKKRYHEILFEEVD
ncbi:MAG: LytTR family DNA-binding domain-containing protein [Clostridium sp.]|nr:LytTR family DNA-binding domain-containing protein [Clostridium sp.]MCM1398767.1 LytTR family DNA-binding domain-containing protein [Clostridium sp.]MCM1458601.1 LytTR family DNA-binding domain-containing protein [Bacteroides sp.]